VLERKLRDFAERNEREREYFELRMKKLDTRPEVPEALQGSWFEHRLRKLESLCKESVVKIDH
jgi:hypothetical protein